MIDLLPGRSDVVADASLKTRWILATAVVAAVAVGGGLGWMRESRENRTAPPVTSDLGKSRLMPNGISGTPAEVYFAMGSVYESDAFNLSQGKRLYSWFGCAECHGDGRGAKGPSFLDGWWLYGPEMVSIAHSIRDGRPHGMPAFRSKMTTEQIWQLAGYIQTIGAYRAKAAAPSRNDDAHTRPSENRAPAASLFDPGPAEGDRDLGPSP